MVSDTLRDDARRTALDVVHLVFQGRDYADAVLDASFDRWRLTPRDRSLTTELVYGTLRWHRWLDFLLQRAATGDWSKVPERIRYLLEIALYQILFLDRIPNHAAVNEAVRIAKLEGSHWSGLVNGILRSILRRPELRKDPIDDDPVAAFAIRWSHPEWLVRRWMVRFGPERTESICRANNERPRLGIRVNRLRCRREEAAERLNKVGYQTRPSKYLDEFLTTERGRSLQFSEPFKAGDIYIQDESAGLVAHLLDPKRGDRILDLAAAPGGKATHLAELSRDKAIVVAVDMNRYRTKKIIENRERLGLGNVFPIVADGRTVSGEFDKVLVDAPCSGLGVIRRRGELRWRKTEKDVQMLVTLQKALLKSAASAVRSDGFLVYSTCTVVQEENSGVVEDFLKHHSEFRVEAAGRFVGEKLTTERGTVETWPDVHGLDGSFAVRFRKTG